MAHTQSALKHVRQTKKHTARNRAVKERIKDAVKNLGKLTAAKNAAEAKTALQKFYKLADKAAKNHIIHRNRANRLKSAWMKRVLTIQ
ncbi:30S ribosomal protein S20 [Candidatus Uhrbacteria bacterium]|nr:30S ribosomal protein S20 [Candidatus Uhrbacteria bacterium]